MKAEMELLRGRKGHELVVSFWVSRGEPRTRDYPGYPEELQDVKVTLHGYDVTRCLTDTEMSDVHECCWKYAYDEGVIR